MSTPFELDSKHLQPLLDFIANLNVNHPEEAKKQLDSQYPLGNELINNIKNAMQAGIEDQTLCHRGEPPVQFSRVFKASEDSADLSADAVLMTAPGPRHKHPNGEFDLCFALEGDPTFDGQPEGWVVYGPGSQHVPTVKNGKMMILYLLPGGAIEFVQK
ncbi:MAG: DUF4863 domain-containing protein [Myxococcales bacterium]|nr:DUF4863 domain-containing protein [Myxococcales bacterium]|tara:strand:- start:363 stop:839 length:477 start_codon:yes stop_codon:yes gene_type:complete